MADQTDQADQVCDVRGCGHRAVTLLANDAPLLSDDYSEWYACRWHARNAEIPTEDLALPVEADADRDARSNRPDPSHEQATADTSFARLAQHLANHLEPWWRCPHTATATSMTTGCLPCETDRAEVGVGLAESLTAGDRPLLRLDEAQRT